MPSPLEIVAALLLLANLALIARENIWSWPLGIAGVAIYAYIYFRAFLFSSAGLQLVFLALNVYGWYAWLRGGERDSELRVTRTPLRAWPLLILIGVAVTAGVGWFTAKYEAAMPYADAAIAGFSLIAQWMMARKRYEHWWIWMLVDIVAIVVYGSRGLYVTAGLYAVFFFMCVWGMVEWRRSLAASAS